MKIIKKLKQKDVGAIGIGAMIVFIAMVLVAGIAASVLIQTSTNLETKAMRAGQETISEVSSGLAVFDIVGKVDGTDDINLLSVTIRPRAGAPDIDMNTTTVILSDGSQKVVLRYDGWTDVTHYRANVSGDNGSVFDTGVWGDLDNEEFGLLVLEDTDGSCTQNNPIINKGDKVAIMIRCDSGACFGDQIAERKDVFGRVIPEIGSPGVISFTTPAAYNDGLYDLQ